MKTRFISLTLCISVLLVCIAGCANGTNTNDSIVTISMSDEAEKYEEEDLAQDGVKAMLGEGYFEQVIEALSGRQDIEELNKTDPELDLYGSLRSAELWAGKENLKNPKNSALYADVSGYPDTMIFQGTNDIVCPDNLLFYQKMKDAGVNVTLVKGEGLWHVFPIYPIPERAEALDLIEAFCAK